METDLLREFDDCAVAESNIQVFLPPDLQPALVERVAMSKIFEFMTHFNQDNNDIRIRLEYPLYVSAVIRANMLGVVGSMNDHETEVIERKFNAILQPILLTNKDPEFQLEALDILVQFPSITEDDAGRRRLLRSLESEQQVVSAAEPYNEVDMYLRATCEGGANCTDAAFEEYLLYGLPALSGPMEIALRNAGRKANTAYFETLTGLVFGESDFELPPLDESLVEPGKLVIQEAKTPYYIWIVLAVDIVIILLAFAYVTKKKMELDEDEEEEAEQEPPPPEQRPESPRKK